ncbi:MAG: hypothetical protein ACOCZG_01950, partial [Halothece sp.]
IRKPRGCHLRCPQMFIRPAQLQRQLSWGGFTIPPISQPTRLKARYFRGQGKPDRAKKKSHTMPA